MSALVAPLGLLAASAMVLCALALLAARRAGPALALAAVQAGCLSVVLLTLAWRQGSWGLAGLAAATLAVKSVALPLALRPFVPALAVAGPVWPGWLAAGVAVAGLAVATGLVPLAMLALAVTGIGVLAVAVRRDAPGQVLGVLVLEHGIVLAIGLAGPLALGFVTVALPAVALLVLLRPLLPSLAMLPRLRGAWRRPAALAAAGLVLALAMALAAWGAVGPVRADPLAGRLAVVVALAGVLAIWHGVRRALAVLLALQWAVLAGDPSLSAAGLAGAALAMVAGVAPWRALMALLPGLGLLLLGVVVMRLPGGGGIGAALLLPGLAACAGLVPLHGWQGRRMVLAPALAAAALGLALRLREVEPVAAVVLVLGLLTLGWAAWRGGAGALHAGLAAAAIGLGADAAGLLLIAAAAVLVPVAGGWSRAGALAALALLPPFALFGAALAVLAAAGPWLAVPLVGLAALAAARVARGLAWPVWQGARAEAPGIAVLLLVLAVGCVPAAARWWGMP